MGAGIRQTYTRFPSGKCVGEWREDTLPRLPGAMTTYCACIHTYIQNEKRTEKINITISYLTGTLLGVLTIDSGTFYTFWLLDRRAHDRDLL